MSENSSAEILMKKRKERRLFTPEEDALLLEIMAMGIFRSWSEVAENFSGRTPRQCRDRWNNYISPQNHNGPWSAEEDRQLLYAVHYYGFKWTVIAKTFVGRSENNVKNRWYTKFCQKTYVSKKDIAVSSSCPNLYGSTSEVKKNRVVLPPISTFITEIPSVFPLI